jgi:hypothetical protein
MYKGTRDMPDCVVNQSRYISQRCLASDPANGEEGVPYAAGLSSFITTVYLPV